MTSRVRAAVAFLPAVLLLAASAAAFLLDGRSLVVTAPIGSVLLGGSGALAVAGVVASLWRRDRRRHAERARRSAFDAAAAEHRRFLDRLDHELKNPITAIRAAVAASGEETPHLATIDAQTARLSRLVGDLRKLSELQTAPIEQSSVDLGAVVTDVAGAVLEAHARSVSVILPAAPWPLRPVTGDPDLLFAAIYNVVANAVKYSSDTDAIEVRGLERDGRVVIEVADTGRGIPASDIPTVFDELARGANARDRPGSGLGLALVRTIVERHAGTVDVTSHEGRGTSVTVAIPVRG